MLKKLACVLATTAVLSVSTMSGICSASDSSDLAAQQKSATLFINAIDGDKNIPEYTAFNKNLSNDLKASINEQAYLNLQRQVKSNFGTLVEAKFFSYERYDQGDKITYIAAFSNQQAIAIVLSFDTNKKLTNFTLSPLQTATENK